MTNGSKQSKVDGRELAKPFGRHGLSARLMLDEQPRLGPRGRTCRVPCRLCNCPRVPDSSVSLFGAIWRDEANTVLLAARTRFPNDIRVALQRHVPAVDTRLAEALGGFRPRRHGRRGPPVGIVIFILLIVSIYFSCRSLTGRTPIVATALIVFNAAVFYFATSVRVYGLAMVLILPCYASFWRFHPRANAVEHFGIRRFRSAGLSGKLPERVSIVWHRNFRVMPLCAGSALETFHRGPGNLHPGGRVVDALRGLGPRIRSGVHHHKSPIALKTIGAVFLEAIAGGNIFLLVTWFALGASTVVALSVQAMRRDAASDEPSLSLYFLIALPVTFSVGTVFFLLHGLCGVLVAFHSLRLACRVGS